MMRRDIADITALFELPFSDLIYRAQTVHRQNFDPNAVQLSMLLSIKTGGCSEDCGYCSQSARFHTDVESQPLLSRESVFAAAQAAKASGATRFCLGAAWRGPKQNDLVQVAEMIRAVKSLGLETCATLGLLRAGQAEQLAQAGLDYYNHNLDTSRAHYDNIVHTHTYEDRLGTLKKVRAAGMKVCCGGIMGMGESRTDRAQFLAELAALDPPPESVPINLLVHIPGTPLSNKPTLDPIEFVRTIAVARLAMPTSFVRLSAGRRQMPDYLQALCFLAGANSIFYGDKLLTTPNPESDADLKLFEKLGIQPLPLETTATERQTAKA
ncbi:MAG: biotin synthase BioB [Gammaproteobacteria bacterium]|nr:biotin synthase BioB [Gammaproteobacteria bacterium]